MKLLLTILLFVLAMIIEVFWMVCCMFIFYTMAIPLMGFDFVRKTPPGEGVFGAMVDKIPLFWPITKARVLRDKYL